MVHLVDYLAVGVIDESGNPLSGGTVTSYEAGTTTLATLYQERELTTPHANPATLDSGGKLVAFADQRLKLVIADSSGVAVRTIDNIGIGDGDVTEDDLASSVAGAGLSGGDGDPLAVNADSSSLEVTAAGLLQIKADGVRGTHLHSSVVDDSTLELASDTLRIKDLGVGTAKIAAGAVTLAKLADLGEVTSGTCSNFTGSATSFTDITNLTRTFTSLGKCVTINLQVDGSVNAGSLGKDGTDDGQIILLRDATEICRWQLNANTNWPGLHFRDTLVTAGSYTYKFQYRVTTFTSVFFCSYLRMCVKEE